MNKEQLLNRVAMGNMLTDELGINTKELFNEALERHKDKDPMIAWQLATREVTLAIIKQAPMWMRFNLLSHSVNSAKEQGVENEIDWDSINQLLLENRGKWDFTAYDYIDSVTSFWTAFHSCQMAGVDFGPWQIHKCKECGENFSMSRGEVFFYEKKKFDLPKRCRWCREHKGEKKAPPPKPVEPNQEDQIKTTAMEEAFKKAGLVT